MRCEIDEYFQYEGRSKGSACYLTFSPSVNLRFIPRLATSISYRKIVECRKLMTLELMNCYHLVREESCPVISRDSCFPGNTDRIYERRPQMTLCSPAQHYYEIKFGHKQKLPPWSVSLCTAYIRWLHSAILFSDQETAVEVGGKWSSVGNNVSHYHVPFLRRNSTFSSIAIVKRYESL